MNLLVAKHKETGSEVLLVDPVIGESFIKFLNKENAETPILISKEEFTKYLDVIKNNIDFITLYENENIAKQKPTIPDSLNSCKYTLWPLRYSFSNVRVLPTPFPNIGFS